MDLRIPFPELKATCEKAFLNLDIDEAKAAELARIHSESSLDGVESHGLNRIPRFALYVKQGYVDIKAEPELVKAKGLVENYDGHFGIGVTNSLFAMRRAVELAKRHGLGLVTMKNNTHWMRGGSYVIEAVKAGMIGICFTNTESSMPLWGAKRPSVGNNPLCIGVPNQEKPLILDMAMSLYSYGKLNMTRLAGEKLAYPGGYDQEGNLTDDPGLIEASLRVLPIGYWKGSGLALALDLVAAAMADGKTGLEMDLENKGSCTGASQVFLAYDPDLFGDGEQIAQKIAERLAVLKDLEPSESGRTITYPGERMARTRAYNLEKGVRVEPTVWQQVKDLAAGILPEEDISVVSQ